MSERDEFEAWKRSINPTILLLRHDHNGSNLMGQYASMIIEDQWQAWQASRATPQQAVPALTDEQIKDLALDCSEGFDESDFPVIANMETAVKFARALLTDATQLSRESKRSGELLKACRRAVMALAHVSERMPQYKADYQAVSDAIEAYVAAEQPARQKYQD